MQIQNNPIMTSNIATNPSQPNVGDILQVTVKERVNNQEAVVSMKGTTSTVKFEGNVPNNDKVLVEITGKTAEGNYTVKVSNRNVEASIPQQANPQNTDLQVIEAVKAFTSRGITVTSENIASIKEFLTNGRGSIEQKMETLQVMAQKQIAISDITLKSVHEALNGKPLSSALSSLLDELGVEYQSSGSSTPTPEKSLTTVRKEVQRELDLSKAIKIVEDFLKNTTLNESSKSTLENSVAEAKRLVQIGQSVNAKVQLIQNLIAVEKQNVNANIDMSELTKIQENGGVAQETDIKLENQVSSANSQALINDPKQERFEAAVRSLIKAVQKEPSLAKVLDKMATMLAEHATNENMEELKQSHDKAQQLEEQGRELAARREISNALSKLEQNIMSQQPSTSENTPSQAEQYAINEAIQTLKMDSQSVMVTEISKKLSQMAIDFKKLKQEIGKNLDNASRMLENRISQANVKQILESTIHKLDNAILKGDFLLYTDMSTEKKLLSASSQLAEAKKLLAKGEIMDANKLVKEVKINIENIIFKPSDVKIKHFVSDKLGLADFSSTKQIANTLEQSVQPLSSQEASSRQIYEAIRKIGLTHENEAGFSLVSKSGSLFEQQQNENVKAALLKMMKNEDMKPQLMQQAEQVVNSITGQQLLNKQDSSGMQNLFFQLPYLMEKQAENIKIYVNSRKDGDKVDWENCSLYFVLETKKLGDIGVLLSSSEKNVSLTFRSNKDHLADKVADLTEITQERFKEIGYKLGNLGVKPLQEPQETTSRREEKQAATLTPTFTAKGYDFSI